LAAAAGGGLLVWVGELIYGLPRKPGLLKASHQADTLRLLSAGFGFRPGHRDLVRLCSPP
jgi:hypothetical protein